MVKLLRSHAALLRALDALAQGQGPLAPQPAASPQRQPRSPPAAPASPSTPVSGGAGSGEAQPETPGAGVEDANAMLKEAEAAAKRGAITQAARRVVATVNDPLAVVEPSEDAEAKANEVLGGGGGGAQAAGPSASGQRQQQQQRSSGGVTSADPLEDVARSAVDIRENRSDVLVVLLVVRALAVQLRQARAARRGAESAAAAARTTALFRAVMEALAELAKEISDAAEAARELRVATAAALVQLAAAAAALAGQRGSAGANESSKMADVARDAVSEALSTVPDGVVGGDAEPLWQAVEEAAPALVASEAAPGLARAAAAAVESAANASSAGGAPASAAVNRPAAAILALYEAARAQPPAQSSSQGGAGAAESPGAMILSAAGDAHKALRDVKPEAGSAASKLLETYEAHIEAALSVAAASGNLQRVRDIIYGGGVRPSPTACTAALNAAVAACVENASRGTMPADCTYGQVMQTLLDAGALLLIQELLSAPFLSCARCKAARFSSNALRIPVGRWLNNRNDTAQQVRRPLPRPSSSWCPSPLTTTRSLQRRTSS